MNDKQTIDHLKIGNFIRSVRIDKTLTEKDVAEAIGIPVKNVISWEKGETLPDISLLQPLANLFNVSVEEILQGEPHNFNQTEPTTSEVTQYLLSYANTNVRELYKQSRKQSMFLITIVLAVVIASCMLIDFLTVESITWSAVVGLSVAFAWGAIMPLFIFTKQPILMSMISFSILSIPYLYLLDQALRLDGILVRLAIPVAIASLVFAWAIYLVYRFLDLSWLRFAAIVLFGAAVLNLVINFIVSSVLEQPFFTAINITTAILLIAAGVGLLYYEQKQHTVKAPTNDTTFNVPPQEPVAPVVDQEVDPIENETNTTTVVTPENEGENTTTTVITPDKSKEDRPIEEADVNKEDPI